MSKLGTTTWSSNPLSRRDVDKRDSLPYGEIYSYISQTPEPNKPTKSSIKLSIINPSL
ncbi:hypothetical protein Sjap_025874 [Stephania japonica]|uniref:Uncharacterized protein n=1 Tax=Stephania japonica TaxID=461633 RepID=A0AAP0EAB4_9MAGN